MSADAHHRRQTPYQHDRKSDSANGFFSRRKTHRDNASTRVRVNHSTYKLGSIRRLKDDNAGVWGICSQAEQLVEHYTSSPRFSRATQVGLLKPMQLFLGRAISFAKASIGLHGRLIAHRLARPYLTSRFDHASPCLVHSAEGVGLDLVPAVSAAEYCFWWERPTRKTANPALPRLRDLT